MMSEKYNDITKAKLNIIRERIEKVSLYGVKRVY